MRRAPHALPAHRFTFPAAVLVFLARPAGAAEHAQPREPGHGCSVEQADETILSLLQSSVDLPTQAAREKGRQSRRAPQAAALLQVDAQGATNASSRREADLSRAHAAQTATLLQVDAQGATSASSRREADLSRAHAAQEANVVLIDRLRQELEYELRGPVGPWPVKSKLILAILELLGLGICGIDRCYMGQTCMGVIKGLTLGGFTVWAILDYVSVMVTCLSMHPSINALGFKANFTQGSVTAAFVLVIVSLVLLCCSGTAVRTYMKGEEKEDYGMDPVPTDKEQEAECAG